METNNTTVSDLPVTPVAPVDVPVSPAIDPTTDIIQRASKFVEENAPKSPITEPVDYNSQDLDKLLEGVTDPAIKEQLVKKSKSLEKGFNTKFQEIANLRKQLENISSQSQQWTPEKVKALLQDPTFVQSAQAVVPSTPPDGMTAEEYSQLTDSEKRELAKLPQIEQELSLLRNERFIAQKNEQDSRLKDKYQNYNPQAIDSLTTDLIQGKIQATREDLHKVMDYEAAVVRAYKMGLSDKNNQNKDRMNASVTPSHIGIVPNSDTPEQKPNQSSRDYLIELGKRRLAQSKQMAGAKQ